jgi:hypothetical protein
MTDLTKHQGLTDTAHATSTEAAAAEVQSGTEETEALALTVVNNSRNFEYAAAAEDNGTAGALDGEPGIVYVGEATQAVRVSVRDLDITGGTIAPEATDEATVAVYKNSELVTYADEGFVNELDAVTYEMNIDTVVDAVVPGDVIRVVLQAGDATTEAIDVDVAAVAVVTVG